jgi:predicted nucleic acid-binding protein
MSDLVIDSCVVVKWILLKPDSPAAKRLIPQVTGTGGRLIVLDLVFPEVANAIWKRQRRRLITSEDVSESLTFLEVLPVHVEPAMPLLETAFDIASKYDRSVYDALFVALARNLKLQGITADEPLVNAIHNDFPEIILLRDW